MIPWPHQESMFFASTDLHCIWIIKNPLGSASGLLFYCSPMHMPHDDKGWKRRRHLARIASESLWSPAPVFPGYLEARMDLYLKLYYTPCPREQPLLNNLSIYLLINFGRYNGGKKLINVNDSPWEWWEKTFIIWNWVCPQFMWRNVTRAIQNICSAVCSHASNVFSGDNLLVLWCVNLSCGHKRISLAVTPIYYSSSQLHLANTKSKRKSWSFSWIKNKNKKNPMFT